MAEPLTAEIIIGKPVLLAQFVVERVQLHKPPIIEGVWFQDCKIIGPAVLASSAADEMNTFDGCHFDATVEMMFLPLSRRHNLHGVIGIQGTRFDGCTFYWVAVARFPGE